MPFLLTSDRVLPATAGSNAFETLRSCVPTWTIIPGARCVSPGRFAVELLFLKEHACLPQGREAEYHRALRLVTDGPYARRHFWVGLVLGVAVSGTLVWLWPAAGPLAGVLALIGLWSEEDVLVRAGQATPIS